MLAIINFLTGYTLIRAEGVFAERAINILGENNIFIWGVRRLDPLTLTFFVSRKAASKVFSLSMPQNITLFREKEFGLPAFLSRYKARKALLICPAVVCLLLFLSTQFIWNVNVITDDPAEEALILAELKKLGVKRGALKKSVSQSEVKRQMILSDNSLLWIWVDIKGTSAIVRLAERQAPPEVFDEDEATSVYASRDCVITELIARNGTPRVSVGDTVLKGQLLIEGVMESTDESVAFVHASGTVKGAVWEEKEVSIPKVKEIRTPTGAFTERLSVKFSDFLLKLFINSRISYQTYDIIEEENSFPFLPAVFVKTTVKEVNVTHENQDIASLVKKSEDEFTSSLKDAGIAVKEITSNQTDLGGSVSVTIRALCDEDVALERRMNVGENITVTNS